MRLCLRSATAVLTAAMLATAGCSGADAPLPPPPEGVTFSGSDFPDLQARVGEVITMIRQRDAAGLARQDLDHRGRRGGPDAEKAAAWLVRYFADPFQGPVQAEIDDEQNGPLVMVCLTYGKPQRKLALGFNDYDENGLTLDGPNGLWPSDIRIFTEAADRPPRMRAPEHGTFCSGGYAY